MKKINTNHLQVIACLLFSYNALGKQPTQQNKQELFKIFTDIWHIPEKHAEYLILFKQSQK